MHGLSSGRLCLSHTTVRTDPKICLPLQSLRAAESAPHSGGRAGPHTLRGGASGLSLSRPERATAKECWCRRATHAASYELWHHLLSFFHVWIKWCQTDSSFRAWNSHPFSLTCCVMYTCFKRNAWILRLDIWVKLWWNLCLLARLYERCV